MDITSSPQSFRRIWDAVRFLSKKVDSMKVISSDGMLVSRKQAGQLLEFGGSSKQRNPNMRWRGYWRPFINMFPYQFGGTYNVDSYSYGDVSSYNGVFFVCVKKHTETVTVSATESGEPIYTNNITPIGRFSTGHGEYWMELPLSVKTSIIFG